jgi:transposase
VDDLPDIDALKGNPEAMQVVLQLRDMVSSLQGTIGQLQTTIDQQNQMLSEMREENRELKRLLFGKSRERMPPVKSEIKKRRRKKKGDAEYRRRQARKKRRENAARKKTLPTVEIPHEIPGEQCRCPVCGGTDFQDLGAGEVSYEYEYVPGRFVRRKHVRRKRACRCGEHVVTAPAPARVSDGVQYGPGFHAQVAVAKLADSMPLYRQAKQLKRAGVPICRSTLCDLFHRAASLLTPLHERILERVVESVYVNADETTIQVQHKEKTRRAYIWTFIAEQLAAYVYSPSRSGETAARVLGNSEGYLQVDGYSGYNAVTKPEQRTRVGCLAHVRRYFYKALETAPEEAEHVLELILGLYQVEYTAAEQEVLGTEQHLAMRKLRSADLMRQWREWLDENQPLHPPQSPIGKAITYALNNWESLTVFLENARLSLDNNLSERQLRIIAIGRKNFLFLGHDDAGDNMAVLQTLISSCELNGVNPAEYLTDVLIRIQTHPANRIDELLPDRWEPPDTA